MELETRRGEAVSEWGRHPMRGGVTSQYTGHLNKRVTDDEEPDKLSLSVSAATEMHSQDGKRFILMLLTSATFGAAAHAHPGSSHGRCPFRRHQQCSESLRWTCWSCYRWEASAWSASCWGWKAQWSRSSPNHWTPQNNNAHYSQRPSLVVPLSDSKDKIFPHIWKKTKWGQAAR